MLLSKQSLLNQFFVFGSLFLFVFRISGTAKRYENIATFCACYGLLLVLYSFPFIFRLSRTSVRFPFLYHTGVFTPAATMKRRLALPLSGVFQVVVGALKSSSFIQRHCRCDGIVLVRTRLEFSLSIVIIAVNKLWVFCRELHNCTLLRFGNFSS